LGIYFAILSLGQRGKHTAAIYNSAVCASEQCGGDAFRKISPLTRSIHFHSIGQQFRPIFVVHVKSVMDFSK
jgi:hypothetical protein